MSESANRSVVVQLGRLPENNACVDCGAVPVSWCSLIGVFTCINCAGCHRNLGVEHSQVRSLTLDKFTSEQVQAMRRTTNFQFNLQWEAKLLVSAQSQQLSENTPTTSGKRTLGAATKSNPSTPMSPATVGSGLYHQTNAPAGMRKITPTVSDKEREAFIINKYKYRRFYSDTPVSVTPSNNNNNNNNNTPINSNTQPLQQTTQAQNGGIKSPIFNKLQFRAKATGLGEQQQQQQPQNSSLTSSTTVPASTFDIFDTNSTTQVANPSNSSVGNNKPVLKGLSFQTKKTTNPNQPPQPTPKQSEFAKLDLMSQILSNIDTPQHSFQPQQQTQTQQQPQPTFDLFDQLSPPPLPQQPQQQQQRTEPQQPFNQIQQSQTSSNTTSPPPVEDPGSSAFDFIGGDMGIIMGTEEEEEDIFGNLVGGTEQQLTSLDESLEQEQRHAANEKSRRDAEEAQRQQEIEAQQEMTQKAEMARREQQQDEDGFGFLNDDSAIAPEPDNSSYHSDITNGLSSTDNDDDMGIFSFIGDGVRDDDAFAFMVDNNNTTGTNHDDSNNIDPLEIVSQSSQPPQPPQPPQQSTQQQSVWQNTQDNNTTLTPTPAPITTTVSDEVEDESGLWELSMFD